MNFFTTKIPEIQLLSHNTKQALKVSQTVKLFLYFHQQIRISGFDLVRRHCPSRRQTASSRVVVNLRSRREHRCGLGIFRVTLAYQQHRIFLRAHHTQRSICWSSLLAFKSNDPSQQCRTTSNFLSTHLRPQKLPTLQTPLTVRKPLEAQLQQLSPSKKSLSTIPSQANNLLTGHTPSKQPQPPKWPHQLPSTNLKVQTPLMTS